jgi:DNA-binding MarR family transcriptional regulator
MSYFQRLPKEIFDDINKNKLISADMHFYYYLLSKGGHGSPIYIPEKRMAEDLGVSIGKVQQSIKRLRLCGHIIRKKTAGNHSTRLITFIRNLNKQ